MATRKLAAEHTSTRKNCYVISITVLKFVLDVAPTDQGYSAMRKDEKTAELPQLGNIHYEVKPTACIPIRSPPIAATHRFDYEFGDNSCFYNNVDSRIMNTKVHVAQHSVASSVLAIETNHSKANST